MNQEAIKLISSEGFVFIIDYKAACISNTIKNMLGADGAIQRGEADPDPGTADRIADVLVFLGTAIALARCCRLPDATQSPGNAGTFTETRQGEVSFAEIPARVLERVCQYFYYNLQHQSSCVLILAHAAV
jgi:elongin-C